MKTTLTARHLDLTDALRADVERKMNRIQRVLHPEAQASVELIGGASHAAQEAHVAEVTLVSNGAVLRSTAPGGSPLAALDAVLDKLERQLVRAKQRPRRVRERAAGSGDMLASEGGGVSEDSGDEARAPSIVKNKRFDLAPMFEEDAIAEMDELGHAFFVFLNAETERLGVVYRRRDGNYGLIDPIVEQRGGPR